MGFLIAIAVSSCACAFLLLGFAMPKRGGGQGVRDVGTIVRKRWAAGRSRKVSGESEIPSMLDIVTLGLCAGLSFDASLELYCERYEGRLSQALRNALLAWRLGTLSRSEGLRQAAKAADAPSLVEVAAVVEEALELGLPLADTLTRQADALRVARRASIEERIERVPVKMLIPLGTLIVPAMLLAILGPLFGSVIELGP